eukprot:COSAG02_NODE_18382_length_942_cov_1.039146_1_plen_26_part_10
MSFSSSFVINDDDNDNENDNFNYTPF